MPFDRSNRSAQGWLFGALDVHRDEVHAGELEFLDQTIERRYRYGGPAARAGVRRNRRFRRFVMSFQGEGSLTIP